MSRCVSRARCGSLSAALRDGNRAVRDETCVALAAIGPDASATRTELARLAQSADRIRKAAQAALALIAVESYRRRIAGKVR